MKIIEVQQALARIGLKPGPLDGIWGRQTVAAVRLFQMSRGLEPDGIVGPATLAALFPGTAISEDLDHPSLVWVKEARRLVGMREGPGKSSNPEILDWANAQGIPYKGDDIPWCGLFAAHCIASTLDREPLPTEVLRARAWERFGIKTRPTPGAIMVFWRKSLESGLGHVGFYVGQNNDASAYRILGGNQDDSVSLQWIREDRLVAARWPVTVPPLTPKPITVAWDETLSWNEQ